MPDEEIFAVEGATAVWDVAHEGAWLMVLFMAPVKTLSVQSKGQSMGRAIWLTDLKCSARV